MLRRPTRQPWRLVVLPCRLRIVRAFGFAFVVVLGVGACVTPPPGSQAVLGATRSGGNERALNGATQARSRCAQIKAEQDRLLPQTALAAHRPRTSARLGAVLDSRGVVLGGVLIAERPRTALGTLGTILDQARAIDQAGLAHQQARQEALQLDALYRARCDHSRSP